MMAAALWIGGSVLLIGGICPIVLRGLTGRAETKAGDYDLKRFSVGEVLSESPPCPCQPSWELTSEDLVRAGTTPIVAEDHKTSPTAAPLALSEDKTLVPEDPPSPPREYRGDYYPVEKIPRTSTPPDVR
jgi:hypothetical protein